MRKFSPISDEFRDWLQNGLGDEILEGKDIPHMGTEAFKSRMDELSRDIFLAPVERPDEQFGVDVTFIATFITGNMEPAFRAAALQFLKTDPVLHDPEYAWVFEDLVYPLRKECQYNDAVNFRLLSMILACARHGSVYSRELLLSLYKTYYKKEYNVLKRMKELNMRQFIGAFIKPEGLFDSIQEGPDDDIIDEITARIFVMSEIIGIHLDDSWNKVIEIHNRKILARHVFWKDFMLADQASETEEQFRKQADSLRTSQEFR